jgi:hypothetical protein
MHGPYRAYPGQVRVDEKWDDEAGDPSWASPYVDGAWGRTANPNSVDGELQNLAAFGDGLVRLTGYRRTAAKFVVWLILISTGATIIYGIVDILRTF